MRGRPETKIRLEIRRFLKKMGFAIWDMEQNRPTRQTPGFSDLVVFGHGTILFVEVKTPTGKLTGYQEEFGDAVGENGGTYLVWRDVRDAWDYLVQVGIIKEAA